jgi:hypothetical protein
LNIIPVYRRRKEIYINEYERDTRVIIGLLLCATNLQFKIQKVQVNQNASFFQNEFNVK